MQYTCNYVYMKDNYVYMQDIYVHIHIFFHTRQFISCNWKIYVVMSLRGHRTHYDDVIMTMLASQITSLTVVYSIVYSGVNQREHQSSASLAFVREIHRGPVNFPHKWPVTRKMFPFDDVIMLPRHVHVCWLLYSFCATPGGVHHKLI